MSRQNKKIVAVVAGIVVVGLTLSACGRRGALQEPASATVITTDEYGKPIKQSDQKPDRPFILDGLI